MPATIAPPPSQAAPVPAVTPPPSTAQANEEQSLNEAYGELDSMDDRAPAQSAPSNKPAAKPAAEKSDSTKAKSKPDPDEPEIEEEVDEPEIEAPKPKAKAPAEELPRKTRDLKTVYLDLKEKHQAMEKRVAEYEAKVKDYESRKPEEAAAVMQKLEAAEKRRNELEDHMRYVDYTKSSEFRDKYQKPYEEAWAKAVAELNEITVEGENGAVRQATASDLLHISNLPLGEARKVARELFGESADDVMAHRRKIRELSDAQNKALEDAKTMAADREKMQVVEQQSRQASLTKAWENANSFLKDKFPKAFEVDEADPDDKQAHTRGFALADLLYNGPEKLTPEQVEALPQMFKDAVAAKRPLNQSENTKLHALARVKMANEPRLAMRLKKANSKIAELEKSLKAYEKSEPKGGTGGTAPETPSGWQDDVNREIDSLDEK